jgi:hypothetical protein
MTECPGFDVVLARLMERRGLDVCTLAEQAHVPAAGLRALLEGAVPGHAELRQLAPALGMHVADLIAIAWADVPEDLTPLDHLAGWTLHKLAADTARLQPGQVRELREQVRLMPQEPRPQLTPPPWASRKPGRSPAGVLLRLFANRNLEPTAGYAIWAVSRRVLSGTTPAGHAFKGRELTSEELADYISVLDISAADMSIVTGVDLPAPASSQLPGTTETARLIWDVRRLTADQVNHVRQRAQSYRQQPDRGQASRPTGADSAS